MIAFATLDGLLHKITDIVPKECENLLELTSRDTNFLRAETGNAIGIWLAEFMRDESPELREKLFAARDSEDLLLAGTDLSEALLKPGAESRIEKALEHTRQEISKGFVDRHRAYRSRLLASS